MAVADDTRNPWLRPTDDPTKVDEYYKDGFDDILADRRKLFNDLSWIMKNYVPPRYKHNVRRNPSQIAKDVLNSHRVKFAIDEVSKLSGQNLSEITKEAAAMLDEMAHSLNLTAVRSAGFVLCKLFKNLFSHIYVNVDGINKLGEWTTEYPVLLMPSHRSYFDFLILSYVMFHYNLPLPAIAAAQDFMAMAGVGRLLRGCGAFYIKRTFGADQLYWAIFTEYVQTQLCNGDYPLEFFVEGTRSRTQKAYFPKLGMLSATLEAYFKGMVADILIVPVSISYDRVLEESLFAYELLGVPKPKESTSKLFKASRVLSENFGNVHIVIDSAISLRQFAMGKIDRVAHSLSPRYVVGLLPAEQRLVKDLSHVIVCCQQKKMVVSVWSLIATVILQHMDGITITHLTQMVLWLRRYAVNLGGYIDWPGTGDPEAVVLTCVTSQLQAVELIDGATVVPKVEAVSQTTMTKQLLKPDAFSSAIAELRLAIYRNQLLHIFAKVGLLSLIITSCRERLLSADEAYRRFHFLERLFSKEFVLDATNIRQDFDDTLRALVNTGDVVMDRGSGTIDTARSTTAYTKFLSTMLEPFITGYWLLCEYLLSVALSFGDPASTGKASALRPREAASGAQQLAASLLQQGGVFRLHHYELLNLDMLQNGIAALAAAEAVLFEVRNKERFVVPQPDGIGQVIELLRTVANLPSVRELQELTLQVHRVAVLAKL